MFNLSKFYEIACFVDVKNNYYVYIIYVGSIKP